MQKRFFMNVVAGVGPTPGPVPVWEDQGGTGYGASGTVDADYMGTIDAEDTLFLISCTNSNQTFTTPSGWILVGTNASSILSSSIWQKEATGSETGSVTVNNSGSGDSFAIIVRFSGCITSGVPYEALVISAPQNTDIIPISEITTLGGNRLAIAFYMFFDFLNPGNPSTYTERFFDGTTSGTDVIFALASQEIATAQTVSADSCTMSRAVDTTTYTMALIPAPA